MKRLSLRLPDHQHAALCRVLTHERVERGNRYSLNDLCIRLIMVQLSHSGVSSPHAGSAAPLGDGTAYDASSAMTRGLGYIHIAPPPPVPKLEPTIWPPAAAPQPERLTKPQLAVESESDTPCPENTLTTVSESLSDGPAADGADHDVNESALVDADTPRLEG